MWVWVLGCLGQGGWLLEKFERVEEAATVPHVLSRPGVVGLTWAL